MFPFYYIENFDIDISDGSWKEVYWASCDHSILFNILRKWEGP